MSDGRVKVRPITIMALLAVAALVAAGLYAWLGPTGTNGSPAALPITLGTSKAAGTSGAADIAIAPAQPTIFVAAPDLPALTGSAHAWRLVGPAPDDAAVARLGQALGVRGEVRSQDGGWAMGATDGPQLLVSPAGAHAWSWTYNPSATVTSPPVACARPLAGSASIGAGDTVATTPCGTATTAAPPVGVPDQAAAEQRARTLLGAAGFDLSGWKVTSTADPYSASVTASPVLDGTEVEGLSTSVTFGAQGSITYASGWFGRPERADSYPLVGTTAAIANLQKGDAFGIEPMTGVAAVPELGAPNHSTYSTGAVTTATASPTVGVTTETVGPTVGGASGSGSGSSPGSSGDGATPVPATPVRPTPTTSVEPVTITIDRAEVVLSAQVGTDGSMWLVPAYRLSASSGGTWTVIAVDRKYVAPPPADQGPPKTIEPWGDTTGSTVPGSTEPGSAGSGGSGTGVATPATATAIPNGG